MDSKERDRWTKFNSFDAQLTQATDVIYPPLDVYPYPNGGIELRIDPLDKSLRVTWVMQMTLDSVEPVGSLVDTAAMEATCLWFIYAADQLWANSVNNYTYLRNYRTGAGGQKWGVIKGKHWSGFTRDRWAVWEEVLEALVSLYSLWDILISTEKRTLIELLNQIQFMFEESGIGIEFASLRWEYFKLSNELSSAAEIQAIPIIPNAT